MPLICMVYVEVIHAGLIEFDSFRVTEGIGTFLKNPIDTGALPVDHLG